MPKRRPTTTPRPRLTTPLVRDGGELRPATWMGAIDRVAIELGRIVDRHGPGAVGMFSCSKSTSLATPGADPTRLTVAEINPRERALRSCDSTWFWAQTSSSGRWVESFR